MSSKKVLVPISTGFEEIETCTIVDVIRRAGLEVILATLEESPVTGRSGITIVPDATLADAVGQAPFDMVVLPGGLPNAYNLRDDQRLLTLLRQTVAEGHQVAAICAAPAALKAANLLNGIPATNYPGLKHDLDGVNYVDAPVVESETVTTSQGPGTAMAFALKLVEQLTNMETVERLKADLVVR